MDKAIQSAEELREFFFEIRRNKKKLSTGVFVTSGIRQKILTGVEQGKIILEGQVKNIEFRNLTGGVYQAFIKE